MTDLTNIFGSEIVVRHSARKTDRSYTGFAGADGLTSMFLGTRGYPIIVTGILRGTGASYNAARGDVDDKLLAIEAITTEVASSYTYKGTTYEDVVWDKVDTIPDNNGKAFHMNSLGEVLLKFIAVGRSLI